MIEIIVCLQIKLEAHVREPVSLTIINKNNRPYIYSLFICDSHNDTQRRSCMWSK